jgi:YegS/Rv2252/BmrU family lipid kinase
VREADVFVVVNPASTRYPAEAALAALDGALRGAGLRYRVFEIPAKGEARPAVLREVERALEEGCERIVAVGGDGTVSMVAEGLARFDGRLGKAALGIIPTGTANVLAGELGLPTSLEAAAATVAETGQSLTLDAIRVGGKLFLTQIGIGPDALMIRDTSRESQVKLGRVAYMANFVKRAFRQRPRCFEIELDGSPLRARAWQIIVANVGSIGAPPFTWGPRVDPTDGVLNLCILDARKPLDYARIVGRLLVGRHRKDENTRYLRVHDRVVIRSDWPALVQGDGQVIGKTPVTVRVVPKAVRVLVRRDVEKPAEPAAAAAGAPRAGAASGVGAAGGNGESVSSDVESMLAEEHSRTWVLQGWLKHPVAALEALDAALFLRVNALSLGSAADRATWILSSVMRYGEGWAFVLSTMIAVDFRAGLRTAVEAVPVVGLTMLTVNYPLKRFFRRRRPFIAFVKARVVGARPRDFSFPSGHAAAGFAGALVLGAHAPAFAPVFYALAVAVSLSRVYLGVHYPSDVAFGAFLGASIAALYRTLLLGLLPWLR